MIEGLTLIEDCISEREKDLLEFIYSQERSIFLSRKTQYHGFEYSYKAPYNIKNY